MKSTGWSKAARELAGRPGGCELWEFKTLDLPYSHSQFNAMLKKGVIYINDLTAPAKYFLCVDKEYLSKKKKINEIEKAKNAEKAALSKAKKTNAFVGQLPNRRELTTTTPLPKFIHNG